MPAIIHPLVGYSLLSIGLGLCVFLCVTIKQEMHRTTRNSTEQQRTLERSISQLQAELNTLRAQIVEIEEKAGKLPQLSSPRPGMNTSRRSQVLRMHRRGERAEQISAALGIPQGEIDLLLKVHSAVLVA